MSGFIIGTGEDAARQAFVEGKEEVNLGQSVMKGIKNAALAVAVPLIIKGGQAVVNKIKTPGVNTVAGEAVEEVEEVVEKTVKETSEEVTEEVAEKGAKSLIDNADDVISDGAVNYTEEIVTYRRVQGGTPPNASRECIKVYENGKIRIQNKKSNKRADWCGL